MKGRVFVKLELDGGEEDEGAVNLTRMGSSLESPAWKAARHGIAWESVEGADYYRVLPEWHPCVSNGVLPLYPRTRPGGRVFPGDGSRSGWEGVLS